jgi:hypothetical protein
MMTNDVGGHNENGSDNRPYHRECTLCLRIFFGSAATPGPTVLPEHYCLSDDKGGTDCSFTGYPQCLETASGIPAECYGKTVRETKLIEPISRIGNPRERSEVQIDL